MSATMPAHSNAKNAFVVVGLKPGSFSSSMAASRTTENASTSRTPHIAYVQINGFFASVEQSRRPGAQGKPRLLTILESFTPAVDPDAHHGFYLNFFGSPYLETDLPGTLRGLQHEILRQTGLSVSIGVAKSKVAAVVASRFERPRGLRILAHGTEAAFLATLPVEALHGLAMPGAALHGVAQIDAADLRRRGISSIAELRRVPLPALESAYGETLARQIWHNSRALDVPSSAPLRWCVATVLNSLASLLHEKRTCFANSI